MKISKRLNNIMNEFFKDIPNEYSDEERLDRFAFALLFLMLDEKSDAYYVHVFDNCWILGLLDDIAKANKINKHCNYLSYSKDLDTLKPYLADNALLIYFLRKTTNASFYIPFDYHFLYAIMLFDRENFKFISKRSFAEGFENNIRTRFKEYFIYDLKEDGMFISRKK